MNVFGVRQRESHLGFLRTLSPFAACSGDELRAIGRRSTIVRRSAGSVLVREGAPSREVLILASGVALVTGDGRPDAMLRTGDCFGEADLLAGSSSSATVVALTDVELVVVSHGEFSALLDKVPTFRRRVVTSLAERARAGKI